MADENKPAPVTRAELYPILGSIYMLLACALLGLVQDRQSTLAVVGYFLLFGAALLLGLTFSILGMRERRRSARGTGGLVEPVAPAVRPHD